MEWIKSIDVISKEINFKYGTSSTLKGVFGGILTMLLSIFILSGFISFGMQIFYKTNPKVTYSKSYQDYGKINDTGNFPIMIQLVKRGGILLDNAEQYYNFQVINYQLQQVNGQPVKNITTANINHCRDEDFAAQKDAFIAQANIANLTKYYCFAHENAVEIYGTIGSTYINYIGILINYCQNGTDVVCKSNDEITLAMENLYVEFFAPNYFFDSNNYDDPAKFYVQLYTIPISSSFYKRMYFYYKNVDFTTDVGFIFESLETNSYYQIDSLDQEIYFTTDARFYPQTMSEITLTIIQIKDDYFRNYYKVQNLAADLGGLIQAIFTCLKITNSILSEKFLISCLVDEVFDDKLNEKLSYKLNNNNDNNDNSKNKFRIETIQNINVNTDSKISRFVQDNKKNMIIHNINKNFNSNFNKDPTKSKTNTRLRYIDFLFFYCKSSSQKAKIDKHSKIFYNVLDIRNYIKRTNELEGLKDYFINIQNSPKNIFDVCYLSLKKEENKENFKVNTLKIQEET